MIPDTFSRLTSNFGAHPHGLAALLSRGGGSFLEVVCAVGRSLCVNRPR